MLRKTLFARLSRPAAVLLIALAPGLVQAQSVTSLDQLLEQTRTARGREAQQNQARINEFHP